MHVNPRYRGESRYGGDKRYLKVFDVGMEQAVSRADRVNGSGTLKNEWLYPQHAEHGIGELRRVRQLSSVRRAGVNLLYCFR